MLQTTFYHQAEVLRLRHKIAAVEREYFAIKNRQNSIHAGHLAWDLSLLRRALRRALRNSAPVIRSGRMYASVRRVEPAGRGYIDRLLYVRPGKRRPVAFSLRDLL